MVYNPNCLTESRVYINGERIPVGDIDIHIRNEGPMDMGYYAEGEFASPWRSENYLDLFNTSDDDSAMDTCYIEVYRDDQDEYIPAFRGMVTGVGNAGGDGPERMWKFRARGPAFFLDKIPVQENFSGVGLETILELVNEQVSEKLPIDIFLQNEDILERDDEQLEAEDVESSNVDQDITGNSLIDNLGQYADENETTEQKTFTRNRHTLADVIEWISTKTNILLYFAPTASGSLIQPFTSRPIRKHEAHYLHGAVRVIENNALSEVNPINTLKLNGEAAKTLGSVGDFEIETPNDEFVQTTVRHEPLYKRAGNTELQATVYTETGADSKAEVEQEARKRLYNKITKATEGDMSTLLFTPITPHDAITAQPTCQQSPATDTDPLTYNVNRVHHKIRANGTSTTRLTVGVAVEDGDIVIDETVYKGA